MHAFVIYVYIMMMMMILNEITGPNSCFMCSYLSVSCWDFSLSHRTLENYHLIIVRLIMLVLLECLV